MRFCVYGGFEIRRKPNRHGQFDRVFWYELEEAEPGLANACGVYVFCVQNGDNVVPWYVGKTERRKFRDECFDATKVNYYNEVLVDHNGKPVLFLLPRLTALGRKFSKPTASNYSDVNFLETMIIGIALKKNPRLTNVRKTKMLREMVVPGVINSPQSPPRKRETAFKKALGIL